MSLLADGVLATVQPEGARSQMVLVDKFSPKALHFANFRNLIEGKPCLAELSGEHKSLGVGRQYYDQRRYNKWRYTESAIGPNTPVTICRDEAGYIKLEDTSGDNELYFNVNFWNYTPGNAVNFVGGLSRDKSRSGGGFLWSVNDDGTISPRSAPHLVIGSGGEEIDAYELTGCWKCSCVPCGIAWWRICPSSQDSYWEFGIFLLFFVAPLPVIKYRTREKKGKNVFYNNDPHNGCAKFDKTHFLDVNTVDPGPLNACLKGGRV